MEDHLQNEEGKDHYKVENAIQRLNIGNRKRNGERDGINDKFNMGNKEEKSKNDVEVSSLSN